MTKAAYAGSHNQFFPHDNNDEIYGIDGHMLGWIGAQNDVSMDAQVY